MKNILVIFAVAAAAAAGYLVGDGGALTIAAALVGGAAALALFLAWANSPVRPAETVSLRPASKRATPAVQRAAPTASSAARRVLRPGELARIREQERILAELPDVAVRLADAGRNQIAVIKVLRNYLDIGLKEAREFTNEARKGGRPLVIAGMAVEHAQQFARDIEAAGGAVHFEEPAVIR